MHLGACLLCSGCKSKRMGMVELVDILEAFGQQGLIGCGAVADVGSSALGMIACSYTGPSLSTQRRLWPDTAPTGEDCHGATQPEPLCWQQ